MTVRAHNQTATGAARVAVAVLLVAASFILPAAAQYSGLYVPAAGQPVAATPVAARALAAGASAVSSASPISPALQQDLVTALASGQGQGLVHLATQPGKAQAVARAAEALGAQVVEVLDPFDYLTVRFDLHRVPALAALPNVTGVSLDGKYRASNDPPGDAYSGAPKPPVDPSDPGNFTVNREAVHADEFTAETGADGRGVTIAIIDTGADAGHPDLQVTSGGNTKIVDWQDFSGEGDLSTSRRLTAAAQVQTPWGTYTLPANVSRSGVVHMGIFQEPALGGGSPAGSDGSGSAGSGSSSTGGQFGVLVVDSATAGRYDQIYIDTNGNRRFDDEQPLAVYSERHDHVRLADPAGGLDIVATRISQDGNFINLGFDGNGHGTHVAAVAAAEPQAAQGIKGIAPGARLMVLKALDSAGDGDWDNISRAMVYAAQHGAKIISMSVEGSSDHSGQSPETQLMSRLSKMYNALFITAVGNTGPGIGSAGFPGSTEDVVSVGAAMTTALWQRYYGLTIPHDGLLEFSAAGPRQDGTMGPTLVAPGVAVSAVPFWANASGYDFKWGTSMAAPHVAGAAADLLSAATARGLSPSYRGLKAVLEEGAQPISGYQVVEQGFGQVDLSGAWQALLSEGSLVEQAGPDVRLQSLLPGQATEGLDARSFLPGSVPFMVQNPATPNLRLIWRSTASWLTPDLESLTVPGNGTRVLPVSYQVPTQEGLYSALLRGFPVAAYGPGPTSGPEGRQGPAVDLLSTVVVPYEFNQGNNWQVNIADFVEAAQYKRYFFRVPEGAGGFDLSLSPWPDVYGSPVGRVEVFLFRPDGRLLQDSEPVGEGTPNPSYDVSVDTPMAGAWEAVVLTPADYASQGRTLSLFRIQASLHGVLFPEGAIHVTAAPGQQDVTLTVPALNHGQPFKGSVVGVGLSQPVVDTPPELITLHEGDMATRDLPYVPPGTALLRISLANPTHPGGRVNFSLYHKDEKTGAWQIVTPPGGAEGTQEVLDLPNPAPGQYVVSMIGAELPGGETTYEYRQVLLPAGDGIRTTDAVRSHADGERWTVQTQLRPPLPPGRYYGRLIAQDGQGRMVGYLPVEVSRDLPQATAFLMPQTLSPGIPGWVTLEFRDASGRLVSPLVTINGETYQPQGGQVTLHVGPSQADVALNVAVVDLDFSYAEQVLVAPLAVAALPRDALGPLGTGQDFDWRYQKLLNELGVGVGPVAQQGVPPTSVTP